MTFPTVSVAGDDDIYCMGIERTLAAAGFCAPMQGSTPDVAVLSYSSVQLARAALANHQKANSGRRPLLLILPADECLDQAAAGSCSILLRPISPVELVNSIGMVALGYSVRPEQRTQRAAASPSAGTVGFSTREKDVLRELQDGGSNKLIARRLGIVEATVKVHVKAILKKTATRNRTEAALWARRYYGSDCPRPVASPSPTIDAVAA